LGITESDISTPQQADLERSDLVEFHPLGGEIRNIRHLGIGENTVLDQ
jgi:hypothetical protein